MRISQNTFPFSSTARIDVGFTVLQGDFRMQVLVEVVVTNSRSRTAMINPSPVWLRNDL